MPFIYSVEIGRQGILYETLQVSGLGVSENTNVFTRKGEDVQYAMAVSDEVERMILGWMRNNPFASLLTINNDMPVLTDANINKARKWFEAELLIIGLHSFSPGLISLFKNSDDLNKFASELFNAIDLGISGVKVETENFKDWVSTHDVGELPVETVKQMRSGVLSEVIDFRNTRAVSVEKGVKKISQ